MSKIDRILLIVLTLLISFLVFFFTVFIYYILRYRNTNLFTDRGQKSIYEIPDEEILHQLNKFTLKIIDFPQILSSFMDQRKEEYKVIFYANLIKLYMDNDRILYYFKENTKENIEITIEVLKTIKQIDLSDLVNRTWELYEQNGHEIDFMANDFMWYKFPLRSALLLYIRENVEKFY